MKENEKKKSSDLGLLEDLFIWGHGSKVKKDVISEMLKREETKDKQTSC